jgi:hypothetical protein
MNRQKTVLLTLVGVLVLAVAYAYFQYPRQPRLSEATKVKASESRQPVRRTAGVSEENKFRVRFDWLKNEKAFSGAKQDLFGPLYAVKKGLSLSPGKQDVPPLKTLEADGKTDNYTPPLEFLGYLASEKKKNFFFSQGDDLFVARKGEKFGKQKEYRITQVTLKEIKIKKQGATKLLTISLVAKTPISGFNKQRVQNIKKDFLPHEDVSLPKVPDKANEVPLEPESGVGEEPPAGMTIDPGADWEK